MTERICKDCGAENYSVSFMPTCAEKKVIDAEGVCFTCAFWRIAITKKNETVIEGRIYSVGDPKRPPGPHNGMAGRRFDIEYFDGRRVTTHDLWSGSEVPEQLPPADPRHRPIPWWRWLRSHWRRRRLEPEPSGRLRGKT